MTDETVLDSTDPRVTLDVPFCDCPECQRMRGDMERATDDATNARATTEAFKQESRDLERRLYELRDVAADVVNAWAKTGYSPGLMTPALQKLKEALAK